MDDVLVRANVKAIGFNVHDTGWLPRTDMVDGMIKRGYLTVLEVRTDAPTPAPVQEITPPDDLDDA